MSKRSPLAPAVFPGIPDIAGVRVAGVNAGVKQRGRPDLFLAAMDKQTTIAGVLTRSLTASAPVDWCRALLPKGRACGIVVNAGNANAFTGKAGAAHAKQMAAAAAEHLGVPVKDVFVASTGVIGEKLPANRIAKAVPRLVKALPKNDWEIAARAIMTTDTFPKGAYVQTEIGGTPITIAGIAKGSGMIAPDMATMLSFVFTDAAIPAPILQSLLNHATDRTFNCITVDGDTSTSDTLLLAATGKAGNKKPNSRNDTSLRKFRQALYTVLQDLATQVVKDGEGVSKFIQINVSGAASFQAARKVGLAIGNSPLVKTAIAGEDANWGRVVMAVGKSGQRADRDRLKISMGGVLIAEKGERVARYRESVVSDHLKGRNILIDVDLGIGHGRATVWTCDLTHDYIRINADYRS